MWVIILSLAICNLFLYLYSQILLSSNKNDAEDCKIVNNVHIYNFTSITDRFVQNVFWVLPIIYVFWPVDRTWYGMKSDWIDRRE